MTCEKFENKLKLNDKAIGENCEKINNLNALFYFRLYGIEINVNKLLTIFSTLKERQL